MNKVLYIGNSFQTAVAVNELKDVQLVAVIYQQGKVTPEDLLSAPIECEKIEIISKENLKAVASKFYGKIDFAIMYSFGIILPEEITKNLEVYNLHPGDLRNNRGSSPINWSILLDHKETKMTLHRVNAEIDLGEVISEHSCTIYPHDVPCTLRARINGEIPSMILELLSFRREKKNGFYITEGIYRQRIREEDYTISANDDISKIIAKIRSQYDYDGAILENGGCKIKISSLEDYWKLQDSYKV